MTNDEQRIAIAEVMGWKLWPIVGWTPPGTEPPFTLGSYPPLPNYPNDLNAMHEAWKSSPRELRRKHTEVLFAVVCRDSGWNPANGTNDEIDELVENATAPQRAEAFLRTLGKWKE